MSRCLNSHSSSKRNVSPTGIIIQPLKSWMKSSTLPLLALSCSQTWASPVAVIRRTFVNKAIGTALPRTSPFTIQCRSMSKTAATAEREEGDQHPQPATRLHHVQRHVGDEDAVPFGDGRLAEALQQERARDRADASAARPPAAERPRTAAES